jgi:4-hydroxyphenylacetate 3-monooxygenase
MRKGVPAMGARTGEQYLAGLKARGREIWLGGDKVTDVVDHPDLEQAARSMAAWYDLQFEHPGELLIADDETGEKINISHMIPRSKEDLVRRGVGLTRMAELSMGVMGRLPDYMNVTFAGFAANPTDWRGPNGENTEGAHNLVEFQKRLRRDDLSLTHTIVHPVVDRAKDSVFEGNPVPLHKIGETADSIIVRGGRVLATLAPFADEQTVYPGIPLPPGTPPEYALSFTIPMNAPGLVFVCRDSASRRGDPFDAPFSTRFDEQDAYCIFDDVEIPKDNVWIDGKLDVYNGVMMETSWWPNIMQQTTLRALTKLEFVFGLCNRMAEIVNDTSPQTVDMLAEILGFIELTRSSLVAAVEEATTYPDGGVFPSVRSLTSVRSMMPIWMTRTNEIIKAIGSSNLLAVASRAQLDDPKLRPLLDEFMSGANGVGVEERSAVYRTAWDFVGSAFGSRNELYERNYLASTKTNRAAQYMLYSAVNKTRGRELLDKVLADARRG